MTSLTVPVILTAMAARIRKVDGIVDAFYPAKNQVQNSPAVALYWSGPQNTRIEHGTGGQMWIVSVKAQVLGNRQGNDTPAEFARVDNLLTPIVDAFAVDPDGHGVNSILDFPADIDGRVSRVLLTDLRPSLQIQYAGVIYYAAELYWDIKFHRVPEYLP